MGSWVWCAQSWVWLRGRTTGWGCSAPWTSSKGSRSPTSPECLKNQKLILAGTVSERHSAPPLTLTGHCRGFGLLAVPAPKLGGVCLWCILFRSHEGDKVSGSLSAGDAAADQHSGQRGLFVPEHLRATGTQTWVTYTHTLWHHWCC